ncbi:STE/STE20/FRAY protein kinase [Tremella mesenterica]|uniref:STE/STE20/FRAY protein kinase n=1 Tax=Tremella mesenterica TaxID=5217 RepID=A0A4Q1BRQ1_TREME|nr:STE/STE20/FRAY protein kinase [Tremella mesenterica]
MVAIHQFVERGMLDDEYWGVFSNDFDHYQLGSPVGFGAFSTVYSAIYHPPITSSPNTNAKPSLHIHTGRPCAIKISSLHSDETQLFKETKLLSLSRHPNVLRILAAFTLPPDHRRIAIVTPLITGGSLAGILSWRGRSTRTTRGGFLHLGKKEDVVEGNMGEEEVKATVKQVIDGLIYLHEQGYLHRDLKAGNLLIAADGTVLLADFGVGSDINEPPTPVKSTLPSAAELQFDRRGNGNHVRDSSPNDRSTEYGKRKSFVGTPNWMAPEVIQGEKYDSKADIWSLGITIIELACGRAPGDKDRPQDVLALIISRPSPSLGQGAWSKQMREFVDICLEKDPRKRPTAVQLSEHPWLRGAKKKAFLAQSLLADLLPLEQRQEIRRVPTMSSLASRASSWDFPATPSMPSSPSRSQLFPSLRSPSILSQMQEYFPNLPLPSRGHSRTSSIVSGLPPSPRVSLKQWAERSVSVDPVGSSDEVRRISHRGSKRTGSEGGSKRPTSASGRLRKGQSVSFDEHRPLSLTVSMSDDLIGRGSSPLSTPGILEERPLELKGSMSPVMEATGSSPERNGHYQDRIMTASPVGFSITQDPAGRNSSDFPQSPHLIVHSPASELGGSKPPQAVKEVNKSALSHKPTIVTQTPQFVPSPKSQSDQGQKGRGGTLLARTLSGLNMGDDKNGTEGQKESLWVRRASMKRISREKSEKGKKLDNAEGEKEVNRSKGIMSALGTLGRRQQKR